MINAIVPVIRAGVQAGVGAVLAYLALHIAGFNVSPDAAAVLVLTLTAVLTGLLAKGQQWLERRYPWLGVLLHTPMYSQGLNEVRAAAKKSLKADAATYRNAVRYDERPPL